MDVEDSSSFKHALGRGINLFLGAGFSVLAKDPFSRDLPIGNALTDELLEKFGSEIGSGLNLAQVYTLLARTRRDEVDAYIRERYKVGALDHRYAAIRRADVQTVFTTNVDDLVERIYEQDDRAYVNDIHLSGPSYADRRSIDLVHLHGAISDRNRAMRFGTLDVASSFSSDPDSWRYLRQRLSKAPTLFWGYALNDAGALEALQEDAFAAGHDAWIQIRAAEKHSPILAYYRALGFRIIVGDTDQLLNYLQFNLPDPATTLPRNRHAAPTATLFPDEAVPLPAQPKQTPH